MDKKKFDVFEFLGMAVQCLLWVLVFFLIFVVITNGFDIGEFRYVGF